MKPGGSLAHCPVCQAALAGSTAPYESTHCPRCQAQLWCLVSASGAMFFPRHAEETIYELLTTLLRDQYPYLDSAEWEAVMRDADALDWVELLGDVDQRAPRS
jgi:hypothetical protein